MTKNEWMRWSYQERKKTFLELLGGKCNQCGSTSKLEFDHIDRHSKKDTITNLLTYKIEVIYEEIKKCQLLCEKCHEDKTRNELGRAKHGSVSMYRYHKCRCLECRTIWNAKTNEYKKKAKLLRSSVIGNTSVSGTEDSRIIA